ncbi:2Fe-2S iron-sulfur cluster-binding protein [Inquilinus sp.]|jgi:ferredoxin-NADP reductase|uniref:2Fe-2S iron-sulfur cluster-binding protein n=1 Tax=Inquilinus sp. TaxID=1932117 RepID=UPI003783B87E
MNDFRALRVVARQRESSIITSFHLEPVDPEGWCDFEPGQFLVFRIPTGNGDVLRNYSVSSSPAQRGRYRITVKRETGPGMPDGLGSCFLHDRIRVGDLLTAQGPRGGFVLDRDSRRPVVLLSGGVGLTPLVSMLNALAETDRRVVFVHACDNGDVHALGEEVAAIAASRPGITAHVTYRFPTEADRVAGRHHGEGMVTRELLQRLLPLDDYEFYLCGPAPFMTVVYGILRGLGVPAPRIAYEFFGPATLLEAPAPGTDEPIAQSPSPDTGAATVEFRRSRITAAWDPGTESLLAFAESQGLAPDFSCRAGICGTCSSRLIAGEVDYVEEPLDEPEPGEVLLCCSVPRGPVVLDL